ncbi:MAG: hypothetical protein J6X94_07390 [Lachnospiraceae bacterium]|nr:hypothetical protein [Lachnospiraceae bacterium]
MAFGAVAVFLIVCNRIVYSKISLELPEFELSGEWIGKLFEALGCAALLLIGGVVLVLVMVASSDSGLSYKDYLRIFLLMTNTEELTLRAMDIIESDIRLSPGNGNFRMDACIEMIECSAAIKSSFGSRITIKRILKY